MGSQPRQIDADTAERLVAGVGTDPVGLASLLSAASAPARPWELADEDTAVLAFRRARNAAPALSRRGHSRVRPRALGVRAVAISMVMAAGVVFGVVTGRLPDLTGPLRPSGDATATVASSDPAAPYATLVRRAPRSGPAVVPRPGRSGVPPASLLGLCHAFVAQFWADPGRALANPAFAELITGAGGPDHVAAFCGTALNPPPPTPAPGRPGRTNRDKPDKENAKLHRAGDPEQ